MNSLNKKEPLILLVGDVFFLITSLWLALFLRNLSTPSEATFITHLVPFGFIFLVWILSFYIAGLYEKHTLLLKSNLPTILFNTQVFNSLVAIGFFYLIPFFGITPKTNLFIYLLVSFLAILLWRMYGYSFIGTYKTENALLIGSGNEMKELTKEVNENPLYNLNFISTVDLDRVDGDGFWDEIVSRIYTENVAIIAIDLANEKAGPVLPHLYNLIFSKVQFVDMNKIYEDIFNRVPLTLLKYNWFLENISTSPRVTYDALKRLMDIALSFILGIISLAVYPFVIIAIKIDDGGPAFITFDRIGKNKQLIKIIKFRSMSGNDQGIYGEDGKTSLKITRVGSFLRKTRIDELPQLWNVLRGKISLIGPRPELPALVKKYEQEIPYYNVRHLIKPGLSGWAQIYGEHAHHGADLSMTTNKLSYDLYYIKNRSFMLDLKIALKTIKTLLSQVGI
ncbi:MAG: exopolysaccharide biosynthesis polyprenyl glycosylphosphotransferase [bacterium]|nr:exopolysaccharide biosynthesis polyprenyl glycosylphosphotransferase [bacterium]